jgi:hypothetical protein
MKDEFIESVVLSPRDVQLDVPLMRRLLEKWGYFDERTETTPGAPHAAPSSATVPPREASGAR